jgi:hypothetical protein
MAAGNPGPPMMLVVHGIVLYCALRINGTSRAAAVKQTMRPSGSQIFIQQKLVLNTFARRTFDQDGVFARN